MKNKVQLQKIVVILVFLFSITASAQYEEITWVRKQVGSGTNGRLSGDRLGSSVAISGDILVSGAPYQEYDSSGNNQMNYTGAVYIYSRNQGGTDNWGLLKKLTGASAGTNGRVVNDQFGTSVSISGDILVVGSPKQDYDMNGSNYALDAGAVYVFHRNQGGTNNWGFVKKITGSGTNGRVASDDFGVSVSVSGEVIVVGAQSQGYDTSGNNFVSGAGAAYVFYKNQGGTDNWGFVKKLTGVGTNGRISFDRFGASVSVSGNSIVIGALYHGYDENGANLVTYAGAAFVFYKDQGGTDNWGFVRKLYGSGTNGRVSDDNFGCAVSISGNTIAIGARKQDTDASGGNTAADAGAVYLFSKDKGGTDNWGLIQKMVGSGSNGRNAQDYFGIAVSLSENVLVVGAMYQEYDEAGANQLAAAGAAYVYYKDKGGANNWGLVRKICGEGPYSRYQDDFFGCAVAASGLRIVAGAYRQSYAYDSASFVTTAGAVYVFESSIFYESGSWLPSAPSSGTGIYNCSILDGTPTLTNSMKVNNLWVSSGATPSISSNAFFYVLGNYTNNGAVKGPGTLVLNGSATQTISGTGTTENLGLDNYSSGAYVSMNTTADSLKITGVLTVASGILITNEKLVLKATGTTTYGRIETGGGVFAGDLIVEKVLSNTNAGWRQIGIPVSTSIGNLKGIDLLGLAHGAANERNIYYWNATVGSGNNAYGWAAVNTSRADNLNAYVVYGNNANGGFHDIAGTWRISGGYVSGDQNFTLVASDDPNGGSSSNKTGWNLIPNPYASNLNVSQLWGGSGFPSYKAIHVWDAVNGQYVGICSTGVSVNTYNNSGGTSSATVLQPYQAFWVKTSANQTLTLSDGMRTTSMTGAGVFMKKSYPTIRLTLLDENEHRDQVVVYFHAEGNTTLNEATDAYKLFSLNGEVPSLYLYNKAEGALSIKALPEGMDSVELPLSIQNPGNEPVLLVPDRSELPEEWEVYLKDRRDSSMKLLNVGDTLNCDPGKESEGELFLVMKKKQSPGMGVKEEAVASQLEVGSDGETVWITGKNLSWESSAYRVYDLEGREISQGNVILAGGKGQISLNGLSRGVYVLKLSETQKGYRVVCK